MHTGRRASRVDWGTATLLFVPYNYHPEGKLFMLLDIQDTLPVYPLYMISPLLHEQRGYLTC